MKKTVIIFVNLFVGFMSFFAWIYMGLRTESAGALASSGFSSLKFFTVLSNLFNGVVSLCYAAWALKGKEITCVKKTVKLTATAAVGLTFLTIVGFLGPIYGYPMMFKGANFWLHLILPVMSLLCFMFLERDAKIPFKNTLYAGVPPLIYAIGYVVNILINGKGEWPDTNDFYGFLSWGNAIGAVIAISIVVVTWLIGVGIYFVGKARMPRR